MKFVVVLLLGALVLTGCAGKKASVAPVASKKNANKSAKLIVAPDNTPFGKIRKVDLNARFVILNFPVGTVPPPGRVLNVFRGGLKMGEVRITGPQQDDNTVADISAGQAAEGDEVRGN